MRELKFRVMYKKHSGTWVKNEYILSDLIEMDGDGFLDDNDIVEQFTGLKDKNGKEIYEGDILDVSSVFIEPKKMVVEFSEMACGFEPFVNGCPDCYVPTGKDVVVIGNIHENPELLD